MNKSLRTSVNVPTLDTSTLTSPYGTQDLPLTTPPPTVPSRDKKIGRHVRRFLYRFRLPGEAQKIDRLMNAFARQYHKHNQHNPSHIFRNAGGFTISLDR